MDDSRETKRKVTTADFMGLSSLANDLAKANRFLDAVVENIPDMIFVKDARTLAFQRFNRAGEELLGWTREELLGKTDHDFYPKEQADFFHDKDRETLRNKELVDIPEEPILTRHKGLRWLHTRKVPILDEDDEPLYLLGISEDITARKEAEERAHALERELAAVVRHAADAMVTWSLDGEVVSWNPGAEALYGVPAAEAIGRPIDAIVPGEESAALRAAQEVLVAGGTVPITQALRRCRDGEVEVEERLFLIRDASGAPARIASIARDVGEVARLRRAAEILGGTERLGQDGEPTTEAEAMREVLTAADIVAQDGRATVLLLGETGVGKGWLARRIHARSPRAGKPFFEVNCASLGPQLVESELFGHERGAFTGATTLKLGLVEAAAGGTLLLDEIGELPPAVQAQLLTFLDGRSFRRVGGVRTLTSDVRILAATNVDLKEAARKGSFRRDLYYRLNVIPMTVPALRDRAEDLPRLARAVLHELAPTADRRRLTLGREVLAALRRYDWPGNVRELRNALERALILSRGAPIALEHLPTEIRQREPETDPGHDLEAMEREHIERVLESVEGNRTQAAARLGISRSTLKRKLAQMRAGRTSGRSE